MISRPRFCLLCCTHATPIKMRETDRHSQDPIWASNVHVILYLFVCHSFFLGKRWGELRHVLCLESYREFSNTCFSDWVCLLNVTTRLLKAVCFSYFQDPSFLNNVFPISRSNCWWLLRRCPKEWEWKVAYLKNRLTNVAKQCLQLRHCIQLRDMSYCSKSCCKPFQKLPFHQCLPWSVLKASFSLCVLCHFVNTKKTIISFMLQMTQKPCSCSPW